MINKQRLAEAKARLGPQKRRYRKKYVIKGPQVIKHRGLRHMKVGDAIWKRRKSQAGVFTARLAVDDWELHVMRVLYKSGRKWYWRYIALAVQGDNVFSQYADELYTTSEAHVLNKMFREIVGIVFKVG